jgi:hypothetical protein
MTAAPQRTHVELRAARADDGGNESARFL